MAQAEFEKCGLGKLTSEEIANLNRWITDLAARAMALANKEPWAKGDSSVQMTTLNLEACLGCKIVANDGTFLGVVSKDKYDSQSLANKYGDYGSKYATKAIFNKYGDYGSKYSDLSPFNKYASKPPVLLREGSAVGYLTLNVSLSPRVDPYLLLGWLEIER